MKIHVIETGNFKLDGGAMFGVVPKSMWHKKVAADDNNMCTWAMRCLLIEDGKQLTLIDTGIGNKQDEKFLSHYYLHGSHSLASSLASKGFNTADVTDVLLTHLHFDHCGGAICRVNDSLVPTFSNAKYWSNATHWHNATMPNEREQASFLADNILPIQQSGQLNFIAEQNGVAFNNNIKMHFVNGHSQGMMLPLINYKGHQILFAADLFPSPHHIALPWIMGYDMQPLITLAEKKQILQQAMEQNWLIFYEHDAQVACTTLIQNAKGAIIAGESVNVESL
jgi:glyoxylase-like metal-dependent hydrolase (beta-lactamase superfamily II)